MAGESLLKLPPRWMPLDLTEDKSILVQVMVWCHQATSHYLNQCWPRYPMPCMAFLGLNGLRMILVNNLFGGLFQFTNFHFHETLDLHLHEILKTAASIRGMIQGHVLYQGLLRTYPWILDKKFLDLSFQIQRYCNSFWLGDAYMNSIVENCG